MYYSNKTSEEMKDEDIEKHYITSDSKFIFNTYKTAKFYKQNVFDCPPEIYELINRIGYNDGDRLFPNKKRTSDFSTFVIKIFTKNTYKHVTATDLRSIYLTDYCNSGQKTEEEYNRRADMMAHTRKQQGHYRKIIKDDNPPTSFLSSSSSTSSLPSLPSPSSSSTSTSSVPIIPMPDDQFKEFMS